MSDRSISAIARDIRADWGAKMYFGAKPYIDAMLSLNKITDKYGADDAESIVLYFLSNATSYRGPKAKIYKDELKALLPKRVRRR